MRNPFKSIQRNLTGRNAFDLTHDRKFSAKMGDLLPIMCEEIVPGDSFQVQSEVMIRLAPMLSPVMHMMNCYVHYFFVPNRLVWDNWQNFITGGEDGQDSSIMPYKSVDDGVISSFGKGTLADYLGYNFATDLTGTDVKINAIPFRAYQLIYNEFYRDQDLAQKAVVHTTDGYDGFTEVDIKKRAWEKDYFTSCRPNAQKGGEVTLPLGQTADINFVNNQPDQVWDVANNRPTTNSGDIKAQGGYLADVTGSLSSIDNSNNLQADLSNATAASINDLRRATKLQEWLEKNMRGGSRYIESILHHFGVRSSDARLQRPEYLGGGKSPVVISEVLQSSATGQTGSSTPLGEMGGHGIAVGTSNRFRRTFEEHGFVIGIMSVIPRTAYQQGLRRQFFREDKFDYLWPEFARLGEQEVKNKEIYFDGLDDDSTFGYQGRYNEYRYIPSSVHGDFKDNLSFWHMGRIFTARPMLNQSFIEADVTERIFPVQNEDVLYCQVLNKVRAIRKLPVYNDPSL